MDVFDLESPPQILKSESTGQRIEVNPSILSSNDQYIVQGPGLDIFQRKSHAEHRDDGESIYISLRCSRG